MAVIETVDNRVRDVEDGCLREEEHSSNVGTNAVISGDNGSVDFSHRLMELPSADFATYLSLSPDDIVTVQLEERVLILASGSISFMGHDVALSQPNCPAEGVAFKVAGGMYKKDALKAMLNLKKTGDRCAESWVPDPALRERLIDRHSMLKGSKGDGRVPWYVVSAVYAESIGEKVNFADELASRMLAALRAFKAEGKELRHEQQILQHINRIGVQAHGPQLANIRVLPSQEAAEVSGNHMLEEENLRSKQVRLEAVKMLLSSEPEPVVSEDGAGRRESGGESNASSGRNDGGFQNKMPRGEDASEGRDIGNIPPIASSAAMDDIMPGGHPHEDVIGPELEGQGQEEKIVSEEGVGNVSDDAAATHVQVELRRAEVKLEEMREERHVLSETLLDAVAELEELQSRQVAMLQNLMKVREKVNSYIATGDNVIVDGLREAASCNQVQLAKVAKMHVTRRRLHEKNVSFDERDACNRSQIWELEQAVVDQETRVSALLDTWRAGYVRYEEALLEEEKANETFKSTFEHLAHLQRRKDRIQQQLHSNELDLRHQEMELMRLKHTLSSSCGSGLQTKRKTTPVKSDRKRVRR